RVVQVGGGGIQDRLHEVGAGHRAELEDLDRPQLLGRRVQGCGQGGGIEDVGGEAARPDALTVEFAREGVKALGVRDRRATWWPAVPKRRAAASPRPGPAPMRANVVTVILSR